MNKLISTLLLVTLTLSFVACENASDENSSEAISSAEADITISEEAENDPINVRSEETDISALALLNCHINEDGYYYVDQSTFNITDDYELFRKYFFGLWEGRYFLADDGIERENLLIDDSQNSYIMTIPYTKFPGQLYEIDDHVLAFLTVIDSGPCIHWIDIDSPGTMYITWGGVTEINHLWSRNEDGSPTTTPAVYSLTKTDTPINEPEDNFLSIYKLYEMSRDYGIDIEMLVDIEYESKDDATILYHDDWYQFYPVYLVSETHEKLELKTQVGNVYDEIPEINVSYTLEKIDGEWVRTVEFDDDSVPSVTETTSVTAAKNEDNPIGQDDSKYQLIGAYLNDENEVCVDFSGLPKSEDYDLFRKYFFGAWDSPDGYLPWSLTIDDSENINFAGLGYFGEFYQPSDNVIAFTLLTNGDANVLWLDIANPDVMYTAVFLMTNGSGVFTIEGVTSDVHELAKNDVTPNVPADSFLSIFKLHEMARDYDIDFDLLTNIDYGFVDGKYILHKATYDFYPMYLVSEADDKIVIRTSVGNIGESDLNPIDVICTFERMGSEWNRTVELI